MKSRGRGVLDQTGPSKLALELRASAVEPNGKLPEMSTYLGERDGRRSRGCQAAAARALGGQAAGWRWRGTEGGGGSVRGGGAAHEVMPVAHMSAAYEYVLPSSTSGGE